MWKSTGHWTLLRLSLFSGKSLLETGSLTYCTLSITLRWKDQYTSSKRFYILCNTLANNTRGFICLREREICVDESIIGFQGRTPATQYMPNKHHHRWGLKLWCLCESSSGYTWNFYMYGGADDAVGETIVDKSGDVVIRLISPLLGYGYHMYTDLHLFLLLCIFIFIGLISLELLGLIVLGCRSLSDESSQRKVMLWIIEEDHY